MHTINENKIRILINIVCITLHYITNTLESNIKSMFE